MDLIDEIRYEAKKALDDMQYELRHTKSNTYSGGRQLNLAETLAWGIGALMVLYVGAKYLGVM
jgi:hypothetical protein